MKQAQQTQLKFLDRVRPAIDAQPDGADKNTLMALAEAQDTLERGDVHPKERARAMRRLVSGAAAVASRMAGNAQSKGLGKNP